MKFGNAKTQHQQLCWDCVHTIKGCEWVERFEPVPGWVAEKTRRPYEGIGYHIYECPKFRRIERRWNDYE